MTYIQTMRRIILPQVVKRVLPPVSNETINLLKDTSLVYILAMNDILRITRSIVQRDSIRQLFGRRRILPVLYVYPDQFSGTWKNVTPSMMNKEDVLS